MTDRTLFKWMDSLWSGLRLSQFAFVGGIGYVIDNIVLGLLVEFGRLSVVFAKPVSAECAIAVMFIVNERWTFSQWGAVGVQPVFRRFLKSNFVRFSGALIAYIVLIILTEFYGVHYLIANSIGIGFGFVVNYVAESLFTWEVGSGSR